MGLLSGCRKIHQAFKDEMKMKHLYHGSTYKELDGFSQQTLLLETTMSFTTDFKVAERYGHNGLILQLDDVDKAIQSDKMFVADVSWISRWEENECIILPAKFKQFKQLKAE